VSEIIRNILEQIQKLPEEDRLALEEQLAQLVEATSSLSKKEQPRYSLRGSVTRYDNPTGPVAETDWEALQ
jgi:hypothetical protein